MYVLQYLYLQMILNLRSSKDNVWDRYSAVISLYTLYEKNVFAMMIAIEKIIDKMITITSQEST
jgi:hypothetical protein